MWGESCLVWICDVCPKDWWKSVAASVELSELNPSVALAKAAAKRLPFDVLAETLGSSPHGSWLPRDDSLGLPGSAASWMPLRFRGRPAAVCLVSPSEA